MSVVTNIVVLARHRDFPALMDINAWLREQERGELVDVTEAAESKSRKYMEASIWAGAFNYLPLEELLEMIPKARWSHAEVVRVMVKEQDDLMFFERWPKDEKSRE